ncbi:patatin-like phospholipase family protein [Roseibium aggregatum]|uniref:PNPLA domain-containing protein n=1 Tax=Roseibium aggregatum TaxID=187304 RepID=A0A926P0E6_9HYPH|nr:patatin-like phospholipase family protein [Roseibium aggregatum]MBD1549769.1 hypothetical protein [Roseibium aggregatum]
MVPSNYTKLAIKEIISLLFNRRDRSYETSSSSDGNHIALVIEGGGMRGVTAGGMVSALEDFGLTSCFDSIHGSSAGAATGAYFLSNQASFGTSLFYEDINNRNFINPINVLFGKPILDTSFLVDFAMVKKKPIDFKKLQASKAKLYISCTDIDLASPYIISGFKTYDHYRSLLKASMTLPFIAGSAAKVDGRRLLDGGLLQQIAIDSAIQAGAT